MDTFVELKAVITDFTAKMAIARGEMEKTSKAGQGHFAALGKAAGVGVAGIAAGAAGIALASVKMAGDFQQNMEKLVTSGGELQRNLKPDMQGVMTLMGQTGTSSSQLAAGLYVINSAGFHGAAGLKVLQAAAEGAKTENADLAVVTDGVTTLMNDYHVSAAGAAEVTSKMVEATSLGKTTFQDLAGSLHTVAPAADAVGLSMNEVLGAMATMTAKGTPAADAATYLRQTILQLSNPTKKAADEMNALGLSSIDISQHLGQRGLTGTLDLLTNAIQAKMGPAGTVLIDNMKKAAAAGSNWATSLQAMPPVLQAQIKALGQTGVAVDALKTKQAEGGKLTDQQKTVMAGYAAAMARLPPAYRDVLRGLVANNLGFTDLKSTLAKLTPAQQTAVGALANMVGGTKSMQAALELTGATAVTFKGNVDKVGAASTEAGGHVKGWHDVQETFNQKLSESTQKMAEMGIKIGQKLIPALLSITDWISKHQTLFLTLITIFGVTLVGAFVGATIAAMSFWTAVSLGLIPLIAGLVVGIAYLATHWKQSWDAIKKAFDDAVNFLRGPFGTLALLLLGPLAPMAFLALHWQQIWKGILFVVGTAVGLILTTLRQLGDGFFEGVQGILSAASHLPFIGGKFAEANRAVHQAHQDFDRDMTQWANDAYGLGNQIGQNHLKGVASGIVTAAPTAHQAAEQAVSQTVHSMQLGAQFDGGGYGVGASEVEGLRAGIANNQNAVIAAANAVVSLSIAQMHKAADASAMSKETYAIGQAMAVGVAEGILAKKAKAIAAAQTLTNLTIGEIGGVGTGAPAAASGGWAAAGKAMAAQFFGWTGPEWVALNNVAMRESGWNPNAQNPTSSAYGIAQNIGGRAGYPDPSPLGQIAWMLQYIKARYGDPIGAWQHELSAGWYDRGGYLPPGLSLAYNTTGRPEPVGYNYGAHAGMTVNVYVSGSVTTEQGIVNAIHSGLLEKQRRVPLGIKAS